MRACDFEPLYPQDETYQVPRAIFPTGKKTARHGLVVRRSAQGNRPLESVAMERASRPRCRASATQR